MNGGHFDSCINHRSINQICLVIMGTNNQIHSTDFNKFLCKQVYQTHFPMVQEMLQLLIVYQDVLLKLTWHTQFAFCMWLHVVQQNYLHTMFILPRHNGKRSNRLCKCYTAASAYIHINVTKKGKFRWHFQLLNSDTVLHRIL